MVTGAIVAALIAAGLAVGSAVAKGVQSHKQKKERAAEGEKVTDAMGEAADASEAYREESWNKSMEGLGHQMGQMDPYYAAMEQAYGGEGGMGYERPDMTWLESAMAAGDSRSNEGPKVRPVTQVAGREQGTARPEAKKENEVARGGIH